MGNRSERTDIPAYINPKDTPYLHIQRMSDGTYAYVANLSGMTATSGEGKWSQQGLVYESHAVLQIPLLPPLGIVPPSPPQYDTVQLLAEKITAAGPDLMALLQPRSNLIAVSHGSYWGLHPEKMIADLLRAQGMIVEDEFPRTGGRKRIQEHAVLFQWNR